MRDSHACKHTQTHTQTNTHTGCGPCWAESVHWCRLLGLSERNDYHTSVSTCHWALPVSAMSPCLAQTLTSTDSSIGRFMLMPIVGGCLVCATLCLCVHPPTACVCVCVNSSYIAILLAQPISSVSGRKFNGLNCLLSSAESGDTYQRQVLSIFSIASGICLLGVACMALYRRNKWVMPPSTTLVECAPGCAQRALYYRGMEPNESLSVSQLEDVLAASNVNCVGNIGDRYSCEIDL